MELYDRIVADYHKFDDTQEKFYASKYEDLWDQLARHYADNPGRIMIRLGGRKAVMAMPA